jgi:N-acetylmuramoyl-L-alanine amidase
MLAAMVEEQFIKAGRTSRGQKQRGKGIWVLQATAMPSILVETGYITNRAEEDYLNSKEGQTEIASCITNAVGEYINWLTKNQSPAGGQTTNANSNKEALSFLKAVEQNELLRKRVAR